MPNTSKSETANQLANNTATIVWAMFGRGVSVVELRFTASVQGSRPQLQSLLLPSTETDVFGKIRKKLKEYSMVRNLQAHPLECYYDDTVTRAAAAKVRKPRFPLLAAECFSRRDSMAEDEALCVVIITEDTNSEVELMLTHQELDLPTHKLYQVFARALEGFGRYASHVIVGTAPTQNTAAATA